MTGQAQSYGTQNGEWQTYGGDLKSDRYSPLDQINADNFNKIEVAWRFKTDALGPRPEFNLQATPLMVKGVLYTVGGTRRAAVALDAATGEMLWMHTMNEGKRGESAPRQLSGRGLSYWTDGREDRIIYVTPGYEMVALNAKTGRNRPELWQGWRRRPEDGRRPEHGSDHRRSRPPRDAARRRRRDRRRRRASARRIATQQDERKGLRARV